MDTMDVFISWSGSKSEIVATELKEFIGTILQATNPWTSNEIVSGARWNEEISKKLNDSKYGIICLTKHNINAPWILFEAGALAKSVNTKTYVCPYLIDFDASQLSGPLAMFQAKEADEAGTLKLLIDINFILQKINPDSYLKDERLRILFDKMWPEFNRKLNSLSDLETAEVPMRNLEDMVKEILEITRSIDSPETKDVISLAKKVDEIEDNLNWLESDKNNYDIENLEERINSLEKNDYDIENLEERINSLENIVPKTIKKDLMSLEMKVEKIEDNLTDLEGKGAY